VIGASGIVQELCKPIEPHLTAVSSLQTRSSPIRGVRSRRPSLASTTVTTVRGLHPA
jgi:hypothetical protein